VIQVDRAPGTHQPLNNCWRRRALDVDIHLIGIGAVTEDVDTAGNTDSFSPKRASAPSTPTPSLVATTSQAWRRLQEFSPTARQTDSGHNRRVAVPTTVLHSVSRRFNPSRALSFFLARTSSCETCCNGRTHPETFWPGLLSQGAGIETRAAHDCRPT
jgi:hypothetical protein